MAKHENQKKKTKAASASKGAGMKEREAGGDSSPAPDGLTKEETSATSLAMMHIWQIQAVRDLLVVGAAVGVFWIGHALRAVTVPLLVALLLAYLFEPVIRRLSRSSRISRAGAVTILLVSILSAVLITLALALPLAVGQTARFVDDLRDGTMRARVTKLEQWVPEKFSPEFESLVDKLPAGSVRKGNEVIGANGEDEVADAASNGEIASLVEARVAEEIAPLRDEVAALRVEMAEGSASDDSTATWEMVKRGTSAVFDLLGSIVGIGLLAFLIPFYFFFFSLWYEDVVAFGRELIPDRNKARTLELMGKMDSVVAGFVRGRIVISMIMGALLAIGWLVCGVPYAIPLGLIVGVFCAVPYLGGVGIPLAVGLLFVEQLGVPEAERGIWLGWFGVVLWPTLWFGVVQMVEGYVLTPMIAGKATNLDPVSILVVVLAGGSVMGVYGMLLAIPVAACGKILVMEVLMPRVKSWLRGEAKDPLPISRE